MTDIEKLIERLANVREGCRRHGYEGWEEVIRLAAVALGRLAVPLPAEVEVEAMIERLWAINCGSQECQTTRDEAVQGLRRLAAERLAALAALGGLPDFNLVEQCQKRQAQLNDLRKHVAALEGGMMGDVVYLGQLEAERDRLAASLTKISAIRDDIIGRQSINWSAHIYPLVAALGEAGFEGGDWLAHGAPPSAEPARKAPSPLSAEERAKRAPLPVEVLAGAMQDSVVPARKAVCAMCNGARFIEGSTCTGCHGSGEPRKAVCETCGGTGDKHKASTLGPAVPYPDCAPR